MPNENETPTRIEQYLAKAAGEDADLPSVPMTRIEQYLAKIAGEDVELPEETYTRIEQYLKHIAENGGGGGETVLINNKNISANGEYSASSDDADGYKKVTVAVPNTYAAGDEGKVVSGGSLMSQTAHATVAENGTIDTTLNNSVEVAVPQPSGTKQISITQNVTTTENVNDYASAKISVNVPASAVDSGSKSIDTNGTHDVIGYASAVVAVPEKLTESWHQCPEAVRNYLTAAQAAYPSDADVTVIDDYAPAQGSVVVANTKPVGKTVDGVTFYDNEPNVAEPFATQNKAGTLTALDWLRWINTTYAATASGETYPRGANCRDLGGWACDGGTIKYGILVRGGEPNPVDRELMVDKIGIKTEVQLLPLSEQVDAYKMKSAWGIDWAGNDTESSSVYTLNDSKTLWRKLLEPILDSVIHAKPVYFHCGIGADRTGMIASALEGLLGVNRANIDMEYELTNFSTGWQSLSGGIYRARTYTAYKAIMNQLNNVPLLYGLSDTFRNRWVSFVLSCGIGIDKINEFRAACIDGTPDVITITVPTYTVTNTLTHVTNSNAAQSAEENTAYTATLTADQWYVISTVTVTMGGTDITATAYSNGVISIQNVTGNIVITATATEVVRENLLTMEDGLINKRFNATDTVSNVNGYFVTDHFAFSGGGLRIVKGNTNMSGISSSANYGNCRIGLYDENKTFIKGAYISHSDASGYMSFTVDGDDLVCANLSASAAFSTDWNAVKYIRMTLALDNAASAIGSVSDVLNSGMKIYAE